METILVKVQSISYVPSDFLGVGVRDWDTIGSVDYEESVVAFGSNKPRINCFVGLGKEAGVNLHAQSTLFDAGDAPREPENMKRQTHSPHRIGLSRFEFMFWLRALGLIEKIRHRNILSRENILSSFDPMQEEILVGSRVRHIGCELSPARGEGTVMRQWGSWYFCRNCYIDLSPAFILKPGRWEGAPPVKEMIDTICPECLKEGYPLGSTGGDEIFDVRFGDREHSCHRRLLRVV